MISLGKNKRFVFNPLSANPTKWSNTLKQFVGKLPTNCLSVFDHFVGLALKGLISAKGLCLDWVYLGISEFLLSFIMFTDATLLKKYNY